MRYIVIVAICIVTLMLLVSCGSKDNGGSDFEPVTQKTDKIAGSKVSVADVVDFYYTYSWIGYNAEYLRYRFYVEDGKCMFMHDARKVEDDYGPASEEHRTSYGIKELSQEEWDRFLDLIKVGSINNPKEHTETGDSGPWLYLYYSKGNDVERMEFNFNSLGDRSDFVEFCESLAQ